MHIRIRKYRADEAIIRYDEPLSDETFNVSIGTPYVIVKNGVATIYELTEPPDKPRQKTP